MIWICASIALCLFVALRFLPWGHRTAHWLAIVFGKNFSGAVPGYRGAHWLVIFFRKNFSDAVPTFSDFLTFTALTLSLVGIFYGWRFLDLDNRKTTLERREKELQTDIAVKRDELAHRQLSAVAPKGSTDQVHIDSPAPGARLIGDQVNLHWSYPRHSEHHAYLVEISPRQYSQYEERDSVEGCNFKLRGVCTLFASDPGSQRATLRHVRGEFLWRVVPIEANVSSADKARELIELSDWSEFGSFSIYPTVGERVSVAGVLVGTVYSNPSFSTVDSRDHPVGFDIDLIRLLVWGCLKTDANRHTISYDPGMCQRTTDWYHDQWSPFLRPASDSYKAEVGVCDGPLRREGYSLRVGDLDLEQLQDWSKSEGVGKSEEHISVSVKSFPSLDSAIRALSQGQIDVLVGSITKALKRQSETDTFRFTSGYYNFRSRLYARKGTAVPCEKWSEWMKTSRRLGVISNSTNHWLATSLAEESGEGSLKVIPFDSFTQLEGALERREIDGVLVDDLAFQLERREIDGVLVDYFAFQLENTVPLSGLDSTTAWKHYIQQQIGGDGEQLAFAVAIKEWENCAPPMNWLRRLVFSKEDMLYPPTASWELYCPIQQALVSDEIQRILPILRGVHHVLEQTEIPDNGVAVP